MNLYNEKIFSIENLIIIKDENGKLYVFDNQEKIVDETEVTFDLKQCVELEQYESAFIELVKNELKKEK